ncbi:tellurite resistance TerB family protein [Vreelandella sp. EE7]
MNASTILKQLMQQDDGEFAIKGVLDDPALRSDGQPDHRVGRHASGPSSRSSGFDTKSALGGGALAILMGSGPGRKLTGKALKYGLVAGIGVYAWNAWQSSQLRNGRGGAADSEWESDEARAKGEHVDSLSGERQEQRSRTLLQAMIMAARAAVQNDEQIRASMTGKMHALGADDELHAWVEQQLNASLDAEALAEQADSPEAAREMYLISVAVINDGDPKGRAWLDQLANAMGISNEQASELERLARESR